MISLGRNLSREMIWPKGMQPLIKSSIPSGTKLSVSGRALSLALILLAWCSKSVNSMSPGNWTEEQRFTRPWGRPVTVQVFYFWQQNIHGCHSRCLPYMQRLFMCGRHIKASEPTAEGSHGEPVSRSQFAGVRAAWGAGVQVIVLLQQGHWPSSVALAKDTALVANVQLCAIQMSVKALGDLIKVDPDAIAKPPESLESTAQFPWMCVPSRLAQPSRPSSWECCRFWPTSTPGAKLNSCPGLHKNSLAPRL